MKKRVLVVLAVLLGGIGILNTAAAQQQWLEAPVGDNVFFDFNGEQSMVPFYNLGLAERFADFGKKGHHEELWAKSAILLGVRLNPQLRYFRGEQIKSVSKYYPSYVIADGSPAELIALGINKDNANDYRYRVVMNDSLVVVPWSPIPKLAFDNGARRPYGFIGKFCQPGKQLLIEVENTKNYNLRDGVFFDWRTDFTPVVNSMTVLDKKTYQRIELFDAKTNKDYATTYDPKSGVPANLKIQPDSIVALVIGFKHHETSAYYVYLVSPGDKKPDTVRYADHVSGDKVSVGADVFKKTGKYIFLIKNGINRGCGERVLKIPIEVVARSEKKAALSFKQAFPYIAATLTSVALLFGLYYRRNRSKLKEAAQQKQMAGLKLRSIRSQLNPHFMFNALTSIQNLVNKNDMTGANHYLGKFADLTRHVLDKNNEELVSLEQEVTILDDYLQMEQLRFGFNYEITVDPAINVANTEIPSMLLQPFVENAVKHGVGILTTAGKIEIAIAQEAKDLVFTIKDNGTWVTSRDAETTSGYGLKLSNERLDLLNQLYKGQVLTLNIDKKKNNTIIYLRLSSWL